jgi:hypothetical protein
MHTIATRRRCCTSQRRHWTLPVPPLILARYRRADRGKSPVHLRLGHVCAAGVTLVLYALIRTLAARGHEYRLGWVPWLYSDTASTTQSA